MLNFAKELATGSGALLRDKWSATRTIETKSSAIDLVTDADRASEAWLVAQIQAHFPTHTILGEEGTGKIDLLHQPGHLWVLDPLDGTVNYAHGIPIFAVSIALLHNGQPQVGAIYLPALDELFAAEAGKGATCNGQPIHVSKTSTLRDAVVATGFAYDKHESAQDNLANVAAMLKQIRGIRRLGAACVDLAYVACGRLDGYWEEKIRPWDIAAGALIVQEAGGHVTGYNQKALILDEQHIIASNGKIHDAIHKTIEPYARQYHLGY